MNDQDIEKSLSRFRLKAPTDNTRRRVLAAGHEAWKQHRGIRPAFTVFRFNWVTGYACAAALLLLLNGIYSTWDSMQMAELMTPTVTEQPMDPDLQEFYAELGRNPEVFHRLHLLARAIGKDENPWEVWKQRQEWMRSLDLDV